jgi:hypothetical protein
LLNLTASAQHLPDHLNPVHQPHTRLGDAQLCPGSAALAAINAELA